MVLALLACHRTAPPTGTPVQLPLPARPMCEEGSTLNLRPVVERVTLTCDPDGGALLVDILTRGWATARIQIELVDTPWVHEATLGSTAHDPCGEWSSFRTRVPTSACADGEENHFKYTVLALDLQMHEVLDCVVSPYLREDEVNPLASAVIGTVGPWARTTCRRLWGEGSP